jgi:hypothetical protein
MPADEVIRGLEMHREGGVEIERGNEAVDLTKEPRTAVDFPGAERNLPREPNEAQAFAASAAEESVELVRMVELRRRRSGQGHVAAGGGETFSETIDMVLAREATCEFLGENVEKFHVVLKERLDLRANARPGKGANDCFARGNSQSAALARKE